MARRPWSEGVASGANFLLRLSAGRRRVTSWLPLSIVVNGVINGYGYCVLGVTSYPIITVENVHLSYSFLGMCVIRMG